MTAPEMAQHLLETRGYVVLGSWAKYKRGDIYDFCGQFTRYGCFEAKTVVIAETDYDDALEQCRVLGISMCAQVPFFYRVVGE